jgi:hypothetical protein
MDPFAGENYNSFSALNTGAMERGNSRERYCETGISIIASRMP